MLFVSMLLLFNPLITTAQQTNPARNHALAQQSELQANVPDSLSIIAVRVQFQADDNRLTTGDGTFESGNLSYLDSPDITIDPLPHDKSYFEHHLEFAKNYFETVSGQQMPVEYNVLNDIYQLPQKMEAYSPTGQTFTNEKVAQLVADTWQAVREQGNFSADTLDPQKTAFVIFHAGVGRDIELVGTNLNKTPQDIPSLSMNQQTLGELLNNPSFDGFAVDGSSFRVTNSLILPRTLSRRGEDVTGQEFVLQLSINGLLSASIGSYLGLPDLFNTKTGDSGIGRFGLMDGESFFSYRGLFPPEPSAWEKMFLGWQTPFPITKNTSSPISLPAATFHQNNSIAKYSLSGSEYFLIENRHRDPNNDGITITIQKADGTTTTQSFENNDETFVNQSDGFTDLLETGVLTDVSTFDWSLPGGVDLGPDGELNTSDDRFLNGGMLIWHIDEAVIEQSLASQTVNANPNRRGVDLEEADGAQDIGRAANSDLSQQARGTAFDFWWDGNNASVITLDGDTVSFYDNRFGPDTRPSNESNSGAQSFFELYNFSDNLPNANFEIRPASGNNIEPVNLPQDSLSDQTTFTSHQSEYFASYPLQLSLHRTSADSFLIIPSQQSTYALHLSNSSNPLFDFQSGTPQQPYLGNEIIIGKEPVSNQITITSHQWNGTSWSTNWQTQADANSGFLSSTDDQILLLDFTNQRIDVDDGSTLPPVASEGQRSTTSGGQYTTVNEDKITLLPDDHTYSLSGSSPRLYTGSVQLSAQQSGFFLLTDDDLLVFNPQNFSQPISIVNNTSIGWPAMADINSDGNIDFLYVNKQTGKLEARNANGAMLSYFPIAPPQGSSFIGTPLIAEINKSDSRNIYITGQDSLGMNIHAYNNFGEVLEGFPLYVGGISDAQNQPIHPMLARNTLYAVSHRGELKAWQLDDVSNVLWGHRYGNEEYNKVSGVLATQSAPNPSNSSSVLVKKETYNWPNPAEDHTNLRFQTSGPGHVDVKIITAGGSVVFDKRYQARGGVPEEHQINTQSWSSGLYMAMITANVNGEQARKMIKMVIVH